MKGDKFMRIFVFFDLPTNTKKRKERSEQISEVFAR